MVKVFIASDHAGFEVKNQLRDFLIEKGYEVVDCGAETFVATDDYPPIIQKAAEGVASTPGSFGLVLGKSGAGEAIVANKINGIRAVLAVNEKNVMLARQHNNANVISVGSEITPFEEAKDLVLLFLTTDFSGEERHVRRIDQITAIEKSRT